MKIYTRTVTDMATGQMVASESFDYNGPLSHAGGGGGDKQTTSNEPPKALAPAYGQYGRSIGGFLDEYNPSFFPGQTYADQSGATATGIEGLTGPSEALNAATGYNQDVLSGKYLGLSEPYRNAVMNPAMDAASARMSSYGRSGSPASSYATQKAGMESLMPFYQTERQNQAQASQMLPQLERAGINRQLLGGGMVEGWDQKAIDEAMQRFNYEQETPFNRYQKMGQLLSPGSQYSVSTTKGGGGSNVAGAAGGALSGAAAGSAFGPVGTGIGALIGGVGGYYG